MTLNTPLAREVQQLVRDDADAYVAGMHKTIAGYEDGTRQAGEQFLAAFQADDRYLQATLVVAGFVLSGGAINPMIITAARAVQMAHATLSNNLRDVAGAASMGLHAAEILLANLDAPADYRLKAVSITNRALLLHAQARANTTQHSSHILDSYATEQVLNPLHVGMVLAGADCAATDAITAYALAVGRSICTQQLLDVEAANTARLQITEWSPAELQLITALLEPITQ